MQSQSGKLNLLTIFNVLLIYRHFANILLTTGNYVCKHVQRLILKFLNYKKYYIILENIMFFVSKEGTKLYIYFNF